MANESKKLTVDVIARIDKLEKGMAKAAKTANTQFGKIETRAKKMDSVLAGVGGKASAALKGLVAGFVAGGVAGIVGQVGNIAKGIAEVGDEAKRAGVGVEAFQELRYVAEQNRIGVDSLTDGLKELNLRADEFITTGSGPAAEAFGRLGYGAEELKEKLKDPSALFTEIIGKLGQLDKAAQIRIADEIFGGTGGEKFVQLIEQGEAGLDRTIQTARDLGLVMSEDLIANAAELDRQFNAVSNTVGTALKTAIVEAAAALGSFIERFQAFEAQSSKGLNSRLKEIGLQKLGLDNQIVTAQTKLANGDDLFGINRGALEASIENAKAEITALIEQERQILAILDGRKPPAGGTTPATTPIAPTSPGGGSTRASQAMRDADAVLKLIDALQYEQETIGLSAREYAVSNALRRAGAAATDQQRAQIKSLVGANFDLEESQAAVNDAMAQTADLAQSTFRGMIDDILAGKDAADVLASALGSVGNALFDAGLTAMIGGPFTLRLAA